MQTRGRAGRSFAGGSRAALPPVALDYDESVIPPPLVEGRDFYVDPDGRYVFTAAYLLARGTCCRSGCRHCPYGFDPSAPDRDYVANGDDSDAAPPDDS